MKTQESEQFTMASLEQMTLTPDHRMVYAPGVKAPKSWAGVGFKMLIGSVQRSPQWKAGSVSRQSRKTL